MRGVIQLPHLNEMVSATDDPCTSGSTAPKKPSFQETDLGMMLRQTTFCGRLCPLSHFPLVQLPCRFSPRTQPLRPALPAHRRLLVQDLRQQDDADVCAVQNVLLSQNGQLITAVGLITVEGKVNRKILQFPFRPLV